MGNDDAKFKVENGYLDLYTTRSRPWLTSERDALTKAVHREYKEQLINKWSVKKRDTQRKLRNLDAETTKLSLESEAQEPSDEQEADEEKQQLKQEDEEEKQKADEEKQRLKQ